jgi:transcriptional regulatory protein RtcR
VAHLRAAWSPAIGPARGLADQVLSSDAASRLDRFDRVQLDDVLAVCRDAPTLSAAGRALFDQSRTRKTSANDADRLRKYLARYGLEWSDVKQRLAR